MSDSHSVSLATRASVVTHLNQPIPPPVLQVLQGAMKGTWTLRTVACPGGVSSTWTFESKLGGAGHVVVTVGTDTYRVVLEAMEQGLEAHAVISTSSAQAAADVANAVLEQLRALK